MSITSISFNDPTGRRYSFGNFITTHSLEKDRDSSNLQTLIVFSVIFSLFTFILINQ